MNIGYIISKDKKQKLRNPLFYILPCLIFLIVYFIFIQYIIGIRKDILIKLQDVYFVIEIVVLVFLIISNLVNSVLLIYPDIYQKQKYIIYNYVLWLLFIISMWLNIFDTTKYNIDEQENNLICTISIGTITILPSIISYYFASKGATTHLFKIGLYMALTVFCLGCLNLRIHEMNDSITHLLLWHYIPMIFFAFAGGLIGKKLLKW